MSWVYCCLGLKKTEDDEVQIPVFHFIAQSATFIICYEFRSR